MTRQRQDILELFSSERVANNFLAVGAPMVRYSKFEFRQLLRTYSVKLCFTPMIIADSFNKSEIARRNEFTTNSDDHPLIAQFAANTADEFVTAAQLIYPYVDGVDINCGCPQSWAVSKGYGCGLLREPERMYDIIRTIRRTLPNNFSCSLKMRLVDDDVRATVELARRLEQSGVTFLTIHGRTQWQKCSHPLNVTAMAEIKKSVQIPIVVNGNVRTIAEACDLQRATSGDGVMAARGLLTNPALFDRKFSEVNTTPLHCVETWLNIAAAAGNNISFQCFHHHLTFMWSKKMKRNLRQQFNTFSCKEQVFDFFDNIYNLKPRLVSIGTQSYTKCIYPELKTALHSNISKVSNLELNQWQSRNDGKYFIEFSADNRSNEITYNLEDIFCQNLK